MTGGEVEADQDCVNDSLVMDNNNNMFTVINGVNGGGPNEGLLKR